MMDGKDLVAMAAQARARHLEERAFQDAERTRERCGKFASVVGNLLGIALDAQTLEKPEATFGPVTLFLAPRLDRWYGELCVRVRLPACGHEITEKVEWERKPAGALEQIGRLLAEDAPCPWCREEAYRREQEARDEVASRQAIDTLIDLLWDHGIAQRVQDMIPVADR